MSLCNRNPCRRVDGSAAATIGTLLVLTLVTAGPADGRSRTVRSAADIVADLRAGTPVVLANMTIDEDLDLQSLGVVDASFQCRNCQLNGSLLAAGVTFRRAVDLGGTDVVGRIDFHRATFQGPALFGNDFQVKTKPSGEPLDEEPPGASFEDAADFSLASFEDLASFRAAVLGGAADFTLARFRSDSVFAVAEFDGPVKFASSVFGAGTRFDQAVFSERATFDDATFRGETDFQQAEFLGVASFASTDFHGEADFSQAEFDLEADFVQSSFAAGASFVGVCFFARSSFLRTSSRGAVDFGDATFSGATDFREATLDGLSLRGSDLEPGVTVNADGLTTDDLVLAVGDVDNVFPEDRRSVLEQVETSAKARGEIGVANDAHYRLHVLASQDDSWPRHAADYLVYRGLAGYFVRPLHPIFAALALALGLALWREFRPRAAVSGWRSLRARLGPGIGPLGRLTARLFDSVSSVGRGAKPDPEDPQLGRRLEVLAYRVLIVCALIGLANSNPTLRQMFDALL